jgi:acyl-CoA thioester hydrolase
MGAVGRAGPPLAGPPRPWPPPRIPAPLRLHKATVLPGWVDYNQHLTEWAYLLIFGDNADAFFRFFGIDEAYRAAGMSLYTAETHLRHLRGVAAGEVCELSLQVLGADSKRLHIVHELAGSAGATAATAEQMLVHVDTGTGRVAPFPEQIAGRLKQIEAAHARLGVPSHAGRIMRIPGR